MPIILNPSVGFGPKWKGLMNKKKSSGNKFARINKAVFLSTILFIIVLFECWRWSLNTIDQPWTNSWFDKCSRPAIWQFKVIKIQILLFKLSWPQLLLDFGPVNMAHRARSAIVLILFTFLCACKLYFIRLHVALLINQQNFAFNYFV